VPATFFCVGLHASAHTEEPALMAEAGHGLATTVGLWDVDTGDWTLPGAPAIAATVLDQTRPGSIVLMHDGGGDRSDTAEALPAVIEGLLARGYRFARVDELVQAGLTGT
jgi:peptidoglycan-N-acetylglucosamine deacetylase